MDVTAENIRDALLRERRIRGWSRKQVADRGGPKESTVKHFETKPPSVTLGNLLLYLNALGWSLDDLNEAVLALTGRKSNREILAEIGKAIQLIHRGGPDDDSFPSQ